MRKDDLAADFLAHIGAPDTEPWRVAFARMVAAVGEAMKRTPLRRRGAREGLEEAARLARHLKRLLAPPEVVDPLRALARPDPDAPDPAAVLADLEARARRAAAMVPKGQGEEPLDAHLGRPSAPLLTAACVAVAWRAVRGRMPSPRTGHAADACAILWQAAGGAEDENPHGRWPHHLGAVQGGRTRAKREAKPEDTRLAAVAVARLTASDCLPPGI
jgi:hypothetical protein